MEGIANTFGSSTGGASISALDYLSNGGTVLPEVVVTDRRDGTIWWLLIAVVAYLSLNKKRR